MMEGHGQAQGVCPLIAATPPRRPAPAATVGTKVKNPFERTLVDKLGSSICSPGMFKIREVSGSFKWDIEHVSVLAPTEIVACSSQFEHTPDPVLEMKATAAIERFFSQEVIVPSPFDEPPKRVPLLPMSSEEENTKCDVWTQTTLTFPPILPPEVEEMLKPFLTFTQDQYTNNEADISANASLRRKLRFESNFDEDSDGSEDAENHNCKNEKGSENKIFENIDPQPNMDNPIWNNLLEYMTSPPETCSGMRRYSDEKMALKSPSLSPINKTPKRPSSNSSNYADTMTKFTDSPFSQSTPEKTPQYKSDPELYNSFDISMNEKDENSSDGDFIRLRAEKRSQSELSLNSSGRSRSAMKLDFCMDSSDTSLHLFSSNGVEVDDDDNESASQWKLELKGDNVKNFRAHFAKNQDVKNESIDYYTPNKNTGNRHPRKKQLKQSYSPMQMSLDYENNSNSTDYKLFPNDTKQKPQWLFGKNVNCPNIMEEMVTFKSKQTKENYMECFTNVSKCDVTMCNRSKLGDKTNIDSLSTTKWRRFDSGFNEECTTDLSQHDSKLPLSQSSALYSFQEENKENIYFGEQFHTKHRNFSMQNSFSDINYGEISQFACNYSSTPSKNKNTNQS